MHKNYYKYFYFTNTLDINQIKWVKSKTILVYRNYENIPNIEKLLKLKKYCKSQNIIFLISNELKLVIKYKFDGLYIPAFNKKILRFNKFLPRNKIICGSAHNLKEIRIKEFQGVDNIFISSIFQSSKKKTYLGISKFNMLSNMTKKKIIALGGVNKKNIKKIKMTKAIGIAGISGIPYL